MSNTSSISSLSDAEFDEFLDIGMEIVPKNIKLELDYESEPKITISLITKFFFRSITDKNKEKEFGDENPLDPDHFDRCHLITVPTIQYLNKHPRINDDKPKIKKLVAPEMDERMTTLFAKAINHENPKTSLLDVKHDNFKVDNFQATQLYEFAVPIRKWSTAAQQFPVDVHGVRFAFSLNPLFVYHDVEETMYELMVPGRKSKGKHISKKGNFYPKVKIKKEFPPNADEMVQENILDFDIQPHSMKLYATSPRKPVTKKINFVMTFLLVRHVLGPAINTLAPIYLIALLTPFTYFFDLTGALDDIASYLVTLLLTLVAHRSVMTDAQRAIQKFTTSDSDFMICLLIIVIQMIIFVAVSNDFSKFVGMVNMDVRPEMVLFIMEESIIALWILLRGIGIVRAYRRLVNQKELDLMETEDTISVADYRGMRRDRKLLGKELGETVFLKSLFSINMKILLDRILQDDGITRRRSVGTSLPTNDVFRCHFYQNEKANAVLVKIHENSKFELVYTKMIDLPEDEQEPGKHAAKAVYSYAPTKGKTLLLEVQFLSDKNVFTPKSHREYKQRKIKKALDILHQNSSTVLSKQRVLKMYLESLWVEIFSISKHNFMSKCASDWKLLCLTRRLLESSKPKPRSNAEKQRNSLNEASQLIQNLLATGDFETSKTSSTPTEYMSSMDPVTFIM